MADYTIKIADDKIQRILEAFGHGTSQTDGTWVKATKPEVLEEIKDYIRQRVQAYESRKAFNIKSTEVAAETW